MSRLDIGEETEGALRMEAKAAGFASVEEYLRDHLGIYSEERPKRARYKLKVSLKTKHGRILNEDSLQYMRTYLKDQSVDLIVTSPPFCLIKKKAYGNEDDENYLNWFSDFAREFKRVLKPTGSLVLDLGGSWYQGSPSRSLYHFDLLAMLCRRFGFHLAQDFYWWNPGKLPTPAEWVTVRKIRVKDAVNTIWWLSPTPFPKANNQRIRWPYGESQTALLERGTYNHGLRPSGHNIKPGTFNKDNGGSIPPNLIAVSNTGSGTKYDEYCKREGIDKHPARFPVEIPEMFMHFLTDPGDVVLDPFGGSCATGEAAERLHRSWTCCEMDPEYIRGAIGRFEGGVDPESSRKVRRYRIPSPNQVENGDQSSSPLPADGGRNRRKQ